jgi:leucyl-tRNA synthetase
MRSPDPVAVSIWHERSDSHGAYPVDDRYDPAEVERRWQRRWAEAGLDRTPELPADGAPARPKRYVLCFFPYPSGEGLTVGHLKNYVSGDVVARTWRMRGFDVLHPMGWDAFGLPAENEARATGRHPADTTRAYAANYRRQLSLVSISYDWSREIASTDPAYYRWTQWLFLLLWRRGLIHRASRPQWWCDACQTVLANEQVTETAEGAVCWRGHAGVGRREVTQWFARITDYAQRLLDDLDRLDWPAGIVAQQRHWIGREVDPETGAVRYRLRDWSISRQRFWGAPVPIVHCPDCGLVPVPEAELPVRLPEVDAYPRSGFDAAGRPVGPLAAVPGWAATRCPVCGGAARRDTDTLDGFVCSSWYFLRFASPGETERPFDPRAVARWLPVDLYIGGAEHAVMHLLYARFWTKVLYDAGLVPFAEPFSRLRNQGMVLDATGAKMSKSRPAYVVTPDEAVAAHGADAVRAYVLFLAPFDQDAPWQTAGIAGIRRWLQRAWRLVHAPVPAGAPRPEAEDRLAAEVAAAVTAVSEAIDGLRLNVAVARLMAFTQALEAQRRRGGLGSSAWSAALGTLARLMAPVTPHLAEALWERLGGAGSVLEAAWPEPAVVGGARSVTWVLQVDGVARDRFELPAGAADALARERALASPVARRWLAGGAPRRVVVVPDRLVNLVTR